MSESKDPLPLRVRAAAHAASQPSPARSSGSRDASLVEAPQDNNANLHYTLHQRYPTVHLKGSATAHAKDDGSGHAPHEQHSRVKETVGGGKAGKRSSRIWLVVAIVVIVVGIGFMVYFGNTLFKAKPDVRTYNNYQFTKDGSVWWTQVQKGNVPYNLPFLYAPWEVEDIGVSRAAVDPIWRKQLDKNITVWLSFDPGGTGSLVVEGTNIGRVIGQKYQIFNMKVKAALLSPGSNNESVMTCMDSSMQEFVLTFGLGTKNHIAVGGPTNTCIQFEANSSEYALRMGDAYTYHLLGIMKTTV